MIVVVTVAVPVIAPLIVATISFIPAVSVIPMIAVVSLIVATGMVAARVDYATRHTEHRGKHAVRSDSPECFHQVIPSS